MPEDAQAAKETLLAELREHALVIGEVTLSSGKTAQYYVDAKRALLRPPAFRAAGELIAAEAVERDAAAVGGMTMGADPLASAAIGADAGSGLVAFFVRKERKEHGLQRWIEGPMLDEGTRCLVVEDVVTTGGSTVQAIERIVEGGLVVAGVVTGRRPACGRRGGDLRGVRRRALPRPGHDRRASPRAARPRLSLRA